MRRTTLILGFLLSGCTTGQQEGDTSAYQPCEAAKRVGGFSLQLVPAMKDPPAAAYAQVAGGVGDVVDPRNVWLEQSKDGGCTLLTLPVPFCDPACGAQICAGPNRCVPEPVFQDVGSVTVTGLSSSLPVMAVNQRYYAPLPPLPYPPYAPDAQIRLSATGGKYPAFSLVARGIAPLTFSAAGLIVVRDRPVALKWNAPVQSGSSRVVISLDLAHHGGIAARIECDVADTGAVTIPGPLITKLIERGTAGFPSLNVTRRSIGSTTLAPGCVDFAVASTIEEIVQVEGEISCNGDIPCPAGRTCGRDLKCQ